MCLKMCVQNVVSIGQKIIDANGWPMPKDAADSSESVGISFLTVGGSVWEL